jgi:hypothetical protein
MLAVAGQGARIAPGQLRRPAGRRPRGRPCRWRPRAGCAAGSMTPHPMRVRGGSRRGGLVFGEVSGGGGNVAGPVGRHMSR